MKSDLTDKEIALLEQIVKKLNQENSDMKFNLVLEKGTYMIIPLFEAD